MVEKKIDHGDCYRRHRKAYQDVEWNRDAADEQGPAGNGGGYEPRGRLTNDKEKVFDDNRYAEREHEGGGGDVSGPLRSLSYHGSFQPYAEQEQDGHNYNQGKQGVQAVELEQPEGEVCSHEREDGVSEVHDPGDPEDETESDGQHDECAPQGADR